MRRAVMRACLSARRASPLVRGLRWARLERLSSAAVSWRERSMASGQRPVKRSRWLLVRVSRKSCTRGWRTGGWSPLPAVQVSVSPRTDRAAATAGRMPSRRWWRWGARLGSVVLQVSRGSPDVTACAVCMVLVSLPAIPRVAGDSLPNMQGGGEAGSVKRVCVSRLGVLVVACPSRGGDVR